MGPIGMQEMIAIFVLALVLFGPKKLPELGRMLGKGLSEFRRAKSELKATFESHLNELDRETRITSTAQISSAPAYSAPHYSYPYDEQGTYETGSAPEVVPSEHSASGHALEPAANDRSLPDQPDFRQPETTLHAQPIADTVPRGSSPLPEERPA